MAWKALVTFSARLTVAGVIKAALTITPVVTMRIDFQPPAGTMTLETDITIGMAGLAGRQRTPGLAGMPDRPGMVTRGDGIGQMTIVTHGLSKVLMPDSNIQTHVESAPVRGAADVAAAHLEAIVALVAVIGLVTA